MVELNAGLMNGGIRYGGREIGALDKGDRRLGRHARVRAWTARNPWLREETGAGR